MGPRFLDRRAKESGKQDVTYLPQPPAPPEVAPPAQQPAPDTFYVPGHWVWNGERYAWQAGYWAKVQPGYVWVAGHYRWSPTGYIYIPGYWDLAVSRRGVLYAPVVITPSVVTVGFVYTPAYAVHDTILVDTLWVRPCHCHYYYGDYYGDRYHDWGFESCVVYNQRHYDSIIVYERWDHRSDPTWFDVAFGSTTIAMPIRKCGRHAPWSKRGSPRAAAASSLRSSRRRHGSPPPGDRNSWSSMNAVATRR